MADQHCGSGVNDRVHRVAQPSTLGPEPAFALCGVTLHSSNATNAPRCEDCDRIWVDIESADLDVTGVDDFAARYTVMVQLNELPYATQLRPAPRWDRGTDGRFLAEITLWLREYAEIVRAARSTLAENLQELQKLRAERSAVRSFLGTDQKGPTP